LIVRATGFLNIPLPKLIVKASRPHLRDLHIAVVGIIVLALLSVSPVRRTRGQSLPSVATSYAVTDLGTLGGAQSKAYGINGAGWVVGESQTAVGTSHAFVWSGGAMTEMLSLDQSAARSINGAAVATGENGFGSAFIWSTSSGVANINSPPGGNFSAAFDINDSNVVVGTAEINFSNTLGFIAHPTSGTVVINPFSGGSSSAAYGINNAGQVVGSAQVATGRYHAYVLTGTTMTDLGTLNGLSTTRSFAFAINESAQVVGYSTLTNSLPEKYHAFIWTSGSGMTDMAPLAGNTLANDINNNGQAVGRWEVAPGTNHAFTWTATTGIVDLNDLTQCSGWVLQQATSINDSGQIVGFGTSPSDLDPSHPHAFLLTPNDGSPPASVVSNVSGNGVYGGAGSLTATLSACGLPLVNKNITFKINGSTVGTADTDNSGVATLSSASLTGMNAGSQFVVKATFAGDEFNSGSSAQGPLTVGKTNQTITINTHAPSSAIYGGGFTVAASGSLPIIYSSSGGCTNAGGTFTMTSGSTACTVKYDQPGDGNFNAATQVTEIVTAEKASSTTTVTVSGATYDGSPHGATAVVTGTGGLNQGLTVSYTGTGITNYGPSNTAPTNAGDYSAAANFNADSNYLGSSDSKPFTVSKANQTITVNNGAPATATYNSQFMVAAAANSGLSVVYSSGSPTICTSSGPTFTMISGAGTCVVTYSQAGDDNRNVVQVTENVTAQKASSTTAVTVSNAIYDGSPHGATAVATGTGGLNQNLIVTYAGTGATTYPASSTAPINAGTYTAAATFDSDSNYTISTDSKPFTIAKANQAIAFAALPDKPLGEPDFPVTATATSNLAVSFGASGNCTIAGSTVHVTGAGSCTVTASQAGDGNYKAASSVQRSFNIGKVNQTITFTALPDKTFGDADFPVSATATSNLAVSFGVSGNCTITGSTVHITGAGSCTITASQAGGSDYNAAPNVPRSFNIAKATTTLTLGNLSQSYDGNPKSVTASTTPLGLNVSVVYTQNGSPVTPVNLGNYDVSATINDANYQGSASGTLVIHIPAPVLVLEEGSTTQLAAIDSVTFGRGPFRITSFFNFSADHHTRILFFTSNLGMTQPDAAKLTVQAAGIPLTVEAVGSVTGFGGSYLIVRLEDGLPTGDVQVTITLQGVTSSAGIITIAQ
jgi:probable HAF family extracellular repeat protein